MSSTNVTPGTLSEMDMVLSINQAAVNKQFANLYYTPNSNNPDQNIIDSLLKIGYIPVKNPFTGAITPGNEGVTAWIDPPYVEIGFVDPQTNPSPTAKYKSARFNIPLKCGWVDLEIGGVVMRGFFADWIMSWMVDLGSEAIRDIEEQILHPDAKIALKDAVKGGEEVPSTAFLISSVFCLFENDRIVNSFELRVGASPASVSDAATIAAITTLAEDADNPLASQYTWNKAHTALDFSAGGVLRDPSNSGTLVADMMKVVTKYFVDLGKDPSNPNPYVLGYAVQQTYAPRSTAIPEMVPASFFFSTTPSPSASQPNQATLNFCMLGLGTHQTGTNDPNTNFNAGIIETPYGVITKLGASSNGTLAFSRNLFTTQYIVKEYVSRFQVQPPALGINLTSNPPSIDNSAAHYNTVQDFTYDYEDVDEKVNWRRIQRSGQSRLNVTWSSSLSENPNEKFAEDSLRVLHIRVAGSIHFNVHCWTTLKGAGGGHDGNGKWDDGGSYWADASWSADLKLNTGSDGTWAFYPSLEEQSINLPRDGNGNVVYKSDHHLQGWVAFEDFLASLCGDMMKHYFGKMFELTISQSWSDNITKGLKALNTKVIMPAGDVFEFKGLDTDTEGNVYTHLTYKSILSGSTK
ncbi:hypothetical protein C8F04DRAFT_1277619 [Mycena alexandri]|uniref:Uncharacterized protein n=1 Tax=Mycena alexandri TaxID=1745969 RepID=A0AAD6S1D6_9AGAR|nr:hypothetical protein C8F04DRAFT_1277619 [Mycena alexandri]